MEPAKGEVKLPRQPEPVNVAVWGRNPFDVEKWCADLIKRGEAAGDNVEHIRSYEFPHGHWKQFTIHPRAVND